MRWLHWYTVYIDKVPTEIVVCGYNKREAWEMLRDREWDLYRPGEPLPSRRRIRFDRESSVREG